MVLSKWKMVRIQDRLMELNNNEALDGDEVEQLKDYLNVSNANIKDIDDKYYCAFSIHKDDLRNVYTLISKSNKKWLEEIDTLTPEEMQSIAKKYQNVITSNNQWDFELAEVFEGIVKERGK